MQLSTIEFNGYKRFKHAECNVDGPIVAFVGPNESGKSSLLNGLSWLTEIADRPLTAREQNRREQPEDEELVVRAKYRIDEDDIVAIDGLGLDLDGPISKASITQFRLSRKRDGSIAVGLDTTLGRNRAPFDRARSAVMEVGQNLASADGDVRLALVDTFDEVRSAAEAAMGWTDETTAALATAVSDLEAATVVAEADDSYAEDLVRSMRDALSTLKLALASAQREDPATSIRRLLRRRVPTFLLFSDNDRDISETYDLSDTGVRDVPPAPLRNLLHVAGTNTAAVWDAVEGGDAATLRTLQRRINEGLKERLQPMWTQSELSIDLAINRDGLLEVNIVELDGSEHSIVPISERSDGLRSFLGLVCFLITADLDVPPVLLIDEAERNLHYDAQADLVRVLTRELNVHKVIYTTHSPGCLPMDLGTGIRVVRRNPSDPATSSLENNFWLDSDPGFSPLLFAMGAEAAAFSVLRKAVLAEGVSEMILLPTLLRNATDGSSLDFHVAFGLSNISAARAMGSVALITTFLVDGDEAGTTKRAQLIGAGVSESHAFQLPKGVALEDLIDRATYLKVVNDFLGESGNLIDVSLLSPDLTIARAVDDYARSHLGLPNGVSHKIIASRLANLGPNLKLTRQGKTFLGQLRKKLDRAFQNPYVLTKEK